MKKPDLKKAAAFFKGKGVYMAVAGCAVVVGAAGYLAYNRAVKDISSEVNFAPPDSSSVLQAGGTPQTLPPDSPSVLPPKVTDQQEEQSPGSVTSGLEESVQTAVEVQPRFMPVAGDRILQPFSNGDLVKSETLNVWKTHDGVDLGAPLGAQVKAMTSGTVTDAGQDPMWGYYIKIDHGKGVTGYYYNLAQAMAVKVGDKVDAGDVIGAVGSSAEAETAMEPHLHFALQQNGQWIDPVEYISPSDK